MQASPTSTSREDAAGPASRSKSRALRRKDTTFLRPQGPRCKDWRLFSTGRIPGGYREDSLVVETPTVLDDLSPVVGSLLSCPICSPQM